MLCVRAFLFVVLCFLPLTQPSAADETTIWYSQPARKWTESILIGNGRLGAMIYGSIPRELVRLNEESLWAGEPFDVYPDNYTENLETLRQLVRDGQLAEARSFGIAEMTKTPTSFRSYEPLGDLLIELDHDAKVVNYRRELDMETGVTRVKYTVDGTAMTREFLISAVDDVLAIRLTGEVSGKISLSRPKDMKVTAVGQNALSMDGQIVDVPESEGGPEPNRGGSGPGGKHMKFAGRLHAQVKGGTIRAEADSLVMEGVNEVIVLFTGATDFNLKKMTYDRSIDPGKKAEAILAKAVGRSWDDILRDHVAEHRAMFNRVSIELGSAPEQEKLPTDERLAAVADGADDPGLLELYFQFGRYLLMSSSRPPGRIPANLQGIWSDGMWSPWEADFHTNINLQMNYWPADLCNLSETVNSLTGWFSNVAEKGRVSAKTLYGADGWVAFHAINLFGRTTPSASTTKSQFENSVLDPLAGAWMALAYWRHYEFTQDRAFLREEAYPVLKGAAEFILDYLVDDSDDRLMIIPSTSPENSYFVPDRRDQVRITYNSGYHLTIAREVFLSVIRGSAILEKDAEFRNEVIVALERLPEVKIGEDQTILEWGDEHREKDPGHRHMSHLLGGYPFAQITEKTPKRYEALRKSVDRRAAHGCGGCGWSRAMMAGLYARLQNGDEAHNHLNWMLKKHTGPNLFNRQIDGSFGSTTCIAEMLLQSHAGEIHLLPALPRAWPTGHVHGLKARGGFLVDVDWKDGELVSAVIHGGPGADCVVRYQDNSRKVSVKPGETFEFSGN